MTCSYSDKEAEAVRCGGSGMCSYQRGEIELSR